MTGNVQGEWSEWHEWSSYLAVEKQTSRYMKRLEHLRDSRNHLTAWRVGVLQDASPLETGATAPLSMLFRPRDHVIVQVLVDIACLQLPTVRPYCAPGKIGFRNLLSSEVV